MAKKKAAAAEAAPEDVLDKLPKKYVKVKIEDVVPNTWNPNRMPPNQFKKLVRGISEMYEKTGGIPPITVRKHPKEKGKYEIIDGEHRWRAVKDKKLSETVSAYLVDVDDDLAKRLTLNLNYLRGEADEKVEADVLNSLVKGGNWTTEKLAETLYMDEDVITDRLTTYSDSEALSRLLREEEEVEEGKKKAKGEEPSLEDEVFVKLDFKVSISQAKIIEEELARIGGKLKGKNVRGRSLEFMAVQSATTDLPEDI